MPPRNTRRFGRNRFDGDWSLRAFVACAKSPNRIYLRPLVAQCAKLDLRSITSRRTKRIPPDAATFVTICTRGEFSLKIFLRDVIGTFEDKITVKMRIDRGEIFYYSIQPNLFFCASSSVIYQNTPFNFSLNILNSNNYCYSHMTLLTLLHHYSQWSLWFGERDICDSFTIILCNVMHVILNVSHFDSRVRIYRNIWSVFFQTLVKFSEH